MKKRLIPQTTFLILISACIFTALMIYMATNNLGSTRSVYIEKNSNVESNTRKQKTIGLVAHNMQDKFIADVFNTIKEKAKENANIKVLIYDSEGRKEKQFLQLNEIIGSNVDGIILSPVDGRLTEDFNAIFKKTSIPIMLVNASDPYNYARCVVGFDAFEIGKRQGDFIAGNLKGKGTVLVFAGPQDLDSSKEKLSAFKRISAKYPDLHPIIIDYRAWDRRNSVELLKDIIKRFNTIDGVVVQYSGLTAQLVSSFDRLNIKPVTVAFDSGSEILEVVKEDKISASVYISSSDMALSIYDTAMKAIKSENITHLKNVPFNFITGENVDKHIEMSLNSKIK